MGEGSSPFMSSPWQRLGAQFTCTEATVQQPMWLEPGARRLVGGLLMNEAVTV